MASIFRKDDNFVDKPNRNSFDMSFQNNLTTKFGVLKPCYLQEVLPGDSFKIRPDFALRFLPLVFPVQTRMRAHLHFFYVRNRTIWKDWMDFIGKTKEGLVSPYLKFTDANRSMLDVGGIADMFGVPTVLNSSVPMFLGSWTESSINYYDFQKGEFMDFPLGFENIATSSTLNGEVFSLEDLRYDIAGPNVDNVYVWPVLYGNIPSDMQEYRVGLTGGYNDSYAYFVFECADGNYYASYYKIVANTDNQFDIDLSSFPSPPIRFAGLLYDVEQQQYADNLRYNVIPSASPEGIALEMLPLETIQRFFGVNGEPISALPFRAYEAIYNSFYRNAENNPYMLNGVPEYNKYIPTYDGGADSNNYGLHNRNWEDDFLTTAVQTPQQGNAPLVGLVNGADNVPYIITFANDDGTTNRMRAYVAEGSLKIGPADSGNSAGDVKSDGYVGQLTEALMEAVKFGISINDFRNVNSFQRWLENNVRKGYKYRDQIKGHYGVSVRYDELDMPEFIGGVSRDVSVQQITQSVKNEFGELGEFGGNSYVMGSGDTINHYCDEHGFIIGILSVVPMANYSQLVPKCLIKRDALDFYFPEFAKIGMQPILNKEVTFLESIDEGKKDEIFGYQRPWYDYIARTDEVHGLFRTNLRNFLVGRTFNSLPNLSESFSTIDNAQLNNIFYVDDDEDKILGQIYFDVTAVRPIPIYGIPSIE